MESQIETTLNAQETESSINWIEILSVLWSFRKLIAYVTGGVTLLSIVLSFTLPEYYRSTVTLLPETEKSKLASLGGLSDLAMLAGVNVGGEASLAKLYPTIVKSEAVLKNVIFAQYETKQYIKPVDLIHFWMIEEKTPERSYEVGMRMLRDELEVSIDNKTSVVSIAIETKEAKLSADILNNVSAELDKFIRTKKTSNAGEQRRFIESRLVEVKRDLEAFENALKEFREKNRQVIGSPRLMLEQDRLIRETQINTTIYIELKKQFEIVKIEEIKNIPIINVMDAARASAYKEKPKRSVIVIVAFLISLIGVIGFVSGWHQYGKLLMDFYSKFKAIRP